MKSFTWIRVVGVWLAICIGGGTVVGCGASSSPEPEGSAGQNLRSPNRIDRSDETLSETLDKGTCTAIFAVGAGSDGGGSCQLAPGGNHCNAHYSPDVYTNPNPDPNDVTTYCLCYCNDLPGPGSTHAAESK